MKTTGPKDLAAFFRALATQLAIDLGSKHSPSAALIHSYADEIDPPAPTEEPAAALTPADEESVRHEEKPHHKRK